MEMDYGLQHKNIHNITISLRNDICLYEIHHMALYSYLALYTYFHQSISSQAILQISVSTPLKAHFQVQMTTLSHLEVNCIT